MAADPIIDYIFTDHAVRELRRRGIAKEDIEGGAKTSGTTLGLAAGSRGLTVKD